VNNEAEGLFPSRTAMVQQNEYIAKPALYGRGDYGIETAVKRIRPITIP
jgi:hypothetical protein